MSESDTYPELLAVDEIDLFNPETGEEDRLKKINLEAFEGTNILDHDVVEERISGSWIPRGLTAKVQYRGAIYTIKIAGTDTMGYVKIEDIANISDARDLMDELRGRFLEHFRLR